MPSATPDNDWAIELFRGMAATMVMVVHYQVFLGLKLGIFEFLHTGVDLFFVISGFVFAPYFFGRMLKPAPFFVRRLFRIYPLYALSLLAYAGLRLWQGQPVDHFITHLLFLHTMVSPEIAFYYNPAFWSLPAEVEFYLALPLLAMLGTRRPVFVALALLALAVHLGLAYHSPNLASAPLDAWNIMCVHLPGVLVEFLLGALAWRVTRLTPSRAVRLALLAAGLLGWLLLAQTLSSLSSQNALATNDLYRGNVGFLFAIPYALLVAGLAGWTAQPNTLLKQIALTAGNLSYGIYLLHNALPTALHGLQPALPAPAFGLICVILTLLTAALLHQVVENPARNTGRNWAKKWSPAG
jgi:peptidoglycan/LPS O-acetylase OafA/YrhL